MSLVRKIILWWFILAAPVWMFTQAHMWRAAFNGDDTWLMVANVVALITLCLSFAAALDSRQNQ